MYNKKLSIVLLVGVLASFQAQSLQLSDLINPLTKGFLIECIDGINKALEDVRKDIKKDLKQNYNYDYDHHTTQQKPTVRRFYFSHQDKSSQDLAGISELQDLFNKINSQMQEEHQQKLQQKQKQVTEPQKKKSSDVTFKDIIGQKKALIEVREVVDFLKNSEKYNRLGAQIPKGILLEGPPGNGKTLMAKAIANEADCNFVYESASSFVELYVGAGAKHVRELFEKARAQKPCIIFIDEIDAIGAVNRGGSGNEEYRQTINELLCQLDGFETENDIIVIAATNYAQALDKALTRAGRFDRIVKVPAPDEQGRKEILQYYLSKLPSVNQEALSSLDELAQETKDLSCADMKNLVNEATLLAVRDDAQQVELVHIKAACDKVVKERAKKNNFPLF